MSGPGSDAEEAERRRQLHGTERLAAHMPQQPGPHRPDPIHVLRIVMRDQPGRESYWLARWSLVARLARDAEGSGDTVTDLGPGALMLAQAAQRGDFGMGELVLVGVARDGRWLAWCPPAPVEPVPGSRGEKASRN